MTFAATAEVIRYEGGIPILVDCDPCTLNMDLQHAEHTVAHLASGGALAGLPRNIPVVGMVPVHVGGLMMNVDQIKEIHDWFGGKYRVMLGEKGASEVVVSKGMAANLKAIIPF